MSFAKSREWFARAQKSLAGGTSSVFRKKQKPTPLYFTKGEGSRVWDADGTEMIDYTLAYGPQILGHSHPALVAAVQEQVAIGQTYGAQCELEFIVAEKLLSILPGCERVTYATTGSEAVQVALRLARAKTGRSKIVRFAGHYHGWMDNILVDPRAGGELGACRTVSAGQAEGPLQDVLCLPWNDLKVVEAALARYPGEIAAVILEPFLANGGGIEPRPGYLQGLRDICTAADVVLIFDEVITGFRVALGGAAELYGVTPDLSVFGKAVAGGFPLSVVAGKAAILDQIAEGRVFHAGTLNGNPISLAAALATLTELEKDNGAALKRVRQLGERLQDGMRRVYAERGQPGVVQGRGSVFWTYLRATPIDDNSQLASYDGAPYVALTEALMPEGVLVMGSGRWYVSTAHTAQDIDLTVKAFDRALAQRQV